MENTDLIFQGKIVVKSSDKDQLIKDFDEVLKKNGAFFDGILHSFEFTDCEVIEENEKVDDKCSDIQ